MKTAQIIASMIIVILFISLAICRSRPQDNNSRESLYANCVRIKTVNNKPIDDCNNIK